MNMKIALKKFFTPPADFNVRRIGGLRRFAFTITGFTILGHAFLGFEQPIIMPLFALAVGYLLEMSLELVDALANQRAPYFWRGSVMGFIEFFLPAHISSLAIAMLIYPNENLAPIFFAIAVCIGSKHIFRVAINEHSRHFFNPSNLGIATTLVLFPYVGLAPPYHFTENVAGAGDWTMIFLIFVAGSFLNTIFTGRLPLIGAWLGAFVLQALVRNVVFGTTLVSALMPITGLAFVLFTFYMITDPGTTPYKWRLQVLFGAAVGVAYGIIVHLHIVFGLFFALTLISALRGAGIFITNLMKQPRLQSAPVTPMPAELSEARS